MAKKPDSAVPGRRYYQFGLRTLLLAVTLAGLVFAVSVPAIREWQRQREGQSVLDALMECSGGGSRALTPEETRRYHEQCKFLEQFEPAKAASQQIKQAAGP